LKARSELVLPTNLGDGGELEMRRMFHAAVPASISPGRRPMRGSGFGAAVDMLLADDMPSPADDVPVDAHAEDSSATPNVSVANGMADVRTFEWQMRSTDDIAGSSDVTG
jgi:hypothetical protein